MTCGSTKSLELLEALQECEDKAVLTSSYVSLLIEKKWEHFYSYTLSLTILYAIMLVSLVMILFHTWNPVPLCCVFLVINLLFMMYELAQFLASSCSYWFDPWNYVDVTRGVLCLFWGVLVLRDQEVAFLGEDYQRDLRLIMSLLCFLRGFTYFRSFRMTRLFVYMTLAVVKEMYSFLIIMAYSVFSFGICTSILVGHASIGLSWTTAFSLILGDFDSSTFGFLEWAVFMFAALINVIIMLNLLVSILGDAYGQVLMSVPENDLYMMLDLITEYESLMFWNRNAGTPTIMVSCQRSQDAVSAGSWAGQVEEVKAAIKEEVKTVTGKVGGKIEELERKVESRIAEMKEATEKKMKGIEGKLEAILELLNSRS